MTTEKFKNKYRIPSARLQNWDYGQDGAYFVTICTHRRAHFFGQIVETRFIASPAGETAMKRWYEIPEHFPYVRLDAFVVMPNHVHGIIIIQKKEEESGFVGDGNFGFGEDAIHPDLGKGAINGDLGRGAINVDLGRGAINVDMGGGAINADMGGGAINGGLGGGAINGGVGGGAINGDIGGGAINVDMGGGAINVDLGRGAINVGLGGGAINVGLGGGAINVDMGGGAINVDLGGGAINGDMGGGAINRASTGGKTGGKTGENNPMLQENLSRILRWYKGRTAFECRKINPDFAWQTRFHDHIIRNKQSFLRIRNYIINNPSNWKADKFH